MRPSLPINRGSWFLIIAAVVLITAHRLPAPIQEVPESPTPTPEQSANPKPKRTIKPKATSESSETSTERQTSLPTPKSQATPNRNLFDGTWIGTINGHAGNVEFTLTISGSGTVERDVFRLAPGGPRNATNDGKMMTWHWGIEDNEVVTFTLNSDGRTAVMTSQGPPVFGMGAYRASGIFRKVSP
jgi:hypothetical protein